MKASMNVPHFIRCHWQPWVDTQAGNVTVGGALKGKMIVQERRCAVCNKVDIRRSIGVFHGSYNI